MKLIIYQTEKTVPFSDSYAPLGKFDKLFFSNNKELETSEIRTLLPNKLQEDETVFLIPASQKQTFYELLKSRFSEAKWKEAPAYRPSKDEIGSGWQNELAQFYDNEIEIVEIFSLKIESTNQAISFDDEDEEDEQERKKQILEMVEKLSFILAISLLVFLGWNLFFLDKLEELKGKQISLLLLEKIEEMSSIQKDYWCEHSSLREIENVQDKCHSGDNSQKAPDNVLEDNTKTTENPQQTTNGDYEELKNKADSAIINSHLVTVDKININDEKVGDCGEEGSAFWYACEMWDLKNENKARDVASILAEIIKKYSGWKASDERCQKVGLIYSFIKDKDELKRVDENNENSLLNLLRSYNNKNKCGFINEED